MATQSILKNITITEKAAAELFIDAMEKAAEAAEASQIHLIEAIQVLQERICLNLRVNVLFLYKKLLGER